MNYFSQSADKTYEALDLVWRAEGGRIKGKEASGLGGVHMKDKFIVFLIFIVFLFFSVSPLCADLGHYESDIIKVAFMNGCVRTLQWDVEKIKYLKDHPEVLREQVEYEVKTYMAEVSKINGEPYVMEVVGNSQAKKQAGKGWVW
jgi:hypothetical protein